MVRQIWIEKAGEADVMQMRDIPLCEPDAHHVRIRVSAAGVTYADIMTRRGKPHPGTPRIPLALGFEVAGVIDAIGTDVNDLKVGDEVVAVVNSGGYSEAICVEAWRCIKLPESTDPLDAVAIAINYWTAYHLLNHATTLEAGQRVLIHGASGGVGIALMQFGKLKGLEMYGTASRGKHPILTMHDVTPIDYHDEDFVERLQIFAPAGMDAVFDPIGGTNWARSYQTLSDNGRLVMFGIQALQEKPSYFIIPHFLRMGALAMWPDGKSVRFVGLVPERMKDLYRTEMQAVVKHYAQDEIHPIIDAVYPLEMVRQAHHIFEYDKGIGKVTLTMEKLPFL